MLSSGPCLSLTARRAIGNLWDRDTAPPLALARIAHPDVNKMENAQWPRSRDTDESET